MADGRRMLGGEDEVHAHRRAVGCDTFQCVEGFQSAEGVVRRAQRADSVDEEHHRVIGRRVPAPPRIDGLREHAEKTPNSFVVARRDDGSDVRKRLEPPVGGDGRRDHVDVRLCGNGLRCRGRGDRAQRGRGAAAGHTGDE